MALLYTQPAAAQQDTTFIRTYTTFRALVDTLKTFQLFIASGGTTDTLGFTESHKHWREAFHFLRNKKLSRKNPDFMVIVHIDKLTVSDPIVSENHLYTTRKQDHRQLEVKTPYHLTLSLLIGTHDGRQWQQLRLCQNEPFTKITRRWYNANEPSGENWLQSDLKTSSLYRPDQQDFRKDIISLLRKYRNYYIDRVD
jgi:hypothetical protein